MIWIGEKISLKSRRLQRPKDTRITTSNKKIKIVYNIQIETMKENYNSNFQTKED